MNDFNPKYIKISSDYLNEKLSTLKIKEKNIFNVKEEREKETPLFSRIVESIFKS